MKIVVDDAIPFIHGRLENVADVIYARGDEISPSMVADADALIVRTRTRCDASLLRNSRVKMVATATIGTDHIDSEWCGKNGVEVASAPGCNAPGVAQYVLASLLKAGFNPQSDYLGIVGYGNVGSTLARWASVLGIKTLICDPPRQKAGYRDVEYLSLDYLLEKSDALTLHVPLTASGEFPTKGMISSAQIEKMKKGSVLVNSSRGGVVVEKDLVPFIGSKNIKAVVDVWENEPYINPRLLDLAFIATPHIAGYSLEGKRRGTSMALEALEKKFGFSIDKTGLECIPLMNEVDLTCDIILKSYDPSRDSENLKSHPENFEILRNNYNYRHEPLFLD